MKIILNVDAITPPLTGIGHYALQLARGLVRHPAVADVRFFSAYRWVEDPEKTLEANRAIAQVRHRVPFKQLALHLYNFGRGMLFRWQTRAFQDYILHTPNYILLPFAGPSVTTVHDLSYIHYPQHHPVERIAFMERHMHCTLQQAVAIITDSEFVRRELIEILNVPADKITAIPLGVDSAFHPRDPKTLTGTLERYGLTSKNYLLVVATLEPRKNLARLVKAYTRLAAPLRDNHPLVIVGGSGWLTEDLEKRLARLERSGQIRRLGYVLQEDLPIIYAGAWAFAFPSLYEGFGLPVLEAMASGVPVLTSNRSSLPEVAGGATLLIDPESVDAITAGLEQLLTDTAWRRQAVTDGLRRAQHFSWQRCIENTVDLYRRVLRST